MSDDIVTRLRNECQCSDDCQAVNDPCIPMRAADEIERLRELVAEYKNLYLLRSRLSGVVGDA